MFSFALRDYKQVPSISCVYVLKHPSTSREYIGRSVNLRDRARKHWQELISDTHRNPKIRRVYQKYGGDFTVVPLVIGTPEYCEYVEGKLLEGLDIKTSLNCHKNNIGGWRGQDWSEESRKKLSEARKGKPINKEAMDRAIETRKTSSAWKAHQERMNSPEVRAKTLAAAAKPESRAKAVATRRKNHGSDFFAVARANQIEAARAKLFEALDWAVANNATRGAAIEKFGSSWGSLKKFQREWEALNGPLLLPKRAFGERNGLSIAARRRREKL